jgi:arginyl-tRNA synthetase
MNSSANPDNFGNNYPNWPAEFCHQIGLIALKPILREQLINATSDYLWHSRSLSEGINPQMPILTRENIPLNRTKDIRKVTYISAIAFKLQKAQQQSAPEIAEAIAHKIHLSPDFTTDVRDGWIQFDLTDTGLATWLQRLNQWSAPTQGTENPSNSQNRQKMLSTLPATFASTEDLFRLEYAHARCCSLLRLADREKLIHLSEPGWSGPIADLQIIEPNPIPWLSDRHQLRLVHVTERTLITQLISTLDTLSDFPGQIFGTQLVKLATGLSQDLLIFYSANRIWSEIKTENLALAQARLGLIRATQIVLKFLLEEGLGILAPPEM